MFDWTKKDTRLKTMYLAGLSCLVACYFGYVQARVHDAKYQAEQQFLAKSQPLCQLLAPQQETLAFSSDVLSGGGGDYMYSVRCKDTTDQEVANLTWNRKTGALQQVGNCPVEHVDAGHPLLPRRAAIWQGWHWLVAMGIAAQEARWHVAAFPPREQATDWNIRWTGVRESVFVKVEAHTGMLLEMVIASEPKSQRAGLR